MTSELEPPPWALPTKRNRFGLRTRRPHSPMLFGDISEYLHLIASARETTSSRSYVEDVLRCPYWGLRVLALGVIARWGGKANKSWLMQRAQRSTPAGRALDKKQRWLELETMTSRRVLGPLLKADDARWVLDIWFSDPGNKFYGQDAVLAHISDSALMSRLEAEMISESERRRLAVLQMLAQRRNLPTAKEMTASLVDDCDPAVSGLAAALLRQFSMDDPGR